MLILTRHIGQTIHIGEGVVVEVLEITGYGKKRQVRLGITAPKNLAVHREEIYLKIQSNLNKH